MHIALLINARAEEPVENVVLVSRHAKAHTRQPHLPRHPAGKHVAEVTRRHHELHAARPRLRRQSQPRPHIIHALRQHPGDVDRVHRGEIHLPRERRIAERLFHYPLRVIKRPRHRDGEHIRRARAGHLPLLERSHAAIGIENENDDPVLPQASVNGRAARVPARRPQHRQPPSALCHLTFVEQPQQLQREILERQRRPVKQLQHERPRRDLHQGRDLCAGKLRISLPRQPVPFLPRDLRRKEREEFRRQLCIRKPRPARQQRGNVRQPLRQEKPAIRGQPGLDRLRKRLRLRPAACGMIKHGPTPARPPQPGNGKAPAVGLALKRNRRIAVTSGLLQNVCPRIPP